MRAAAHTESTGTAARLNTNAPAAPVPGSLGTMAGIVKAARALRMAGTAYFGEGMTMLKKLLNWMNVHKRFLELQKSHDARLMLNKRLSKENADLKSSLHQYKKKAKPISEGAQQQINRLSDAHSLRTAKQHLALMRREVLIRRLALTMPAEQYIAISDEVDAMSDEAVLAYKKPKLVYSLATSNSN